MVSKARGTPPRSGWLKRAGVRLAAMVGVAAIASTGLIHLGESPAEAASGPWKNGAGYGYARTSSGSFETGGAWAGNFIDGSGETWACAVDDEGWRPTTPMGATNYPNPTVRTSWEGNALRLDGSYNRRTISGNKLAQAAFVNSHYLASTNNITAAAAKIAQYKIFGVFEGSLAQRHTTNRLPAAVFTRADEIVAEAAQKAGPYTVTTPIVSAEGESGQVTNIAGVKGQTGQFLAGFSYTATISGPANWEGGGKTLTGTTGTSPISRNIVITDNGAVKVTVRVTVPDDRFWVSTAPKAGAQDLMQAGRPRTLTAEGDPIDAILDFQPNVGTKVANQVLQAGDPALDDWTVGVESGQWVPGVSVELKGHLVGPFSEPQTLVNGGVGKTATSVIPAGAPIVGTETHTVTKPGTVQAGADTTVNEPGFYYWVVEIDHSAQSAATQKYIAASFTDGFGVIDESVVVKYTDVSHESTVHEPQVAAGSLAADTITISGIPSWHGGFAGGHGYAADNTTATVKLYGPVAEEPSTKSVPTGTPVAWSKEVPFSNGTFEVGVDEDIRLVDEGYYVFVYEYAGDARIAGFTSDFNDANERVEVLKVAPTISTERESKFVDEADGSVVLRDEVTVSIADDGAWPSADAQGTPATIEARAKVYYSIVPFAERPAGEPVEGTVVGEASASFTSSAPKMVEATLTNGGEPGFYTWVWEIAEGELHEGYVTPSWEEIETTSVRVPSLVHESQVRDDVITTGSQAFDTITIDGIPEYHGEFEGGHGWDQDRTTATVYLYGPLASAPETTEVPEGTPVAWSTEVPFENGTFEVGVDEDDPIVLNEVGHYVFVYEYAGDARIAPFASAFNDPLEQVYVREISVSTTLKHDGDVDEGPVVGDTIWDEVHIEGEIREGDYTVVDLYVWKDNDAPVCDDPVWTSEKIELVEGQTVYETDKFTTTEHGVHGFIETTYNVKGEMISQGVCGDESETITVSEENLDGGASGLAATGANGVWFTGLVAAILTGAGAGALLLVRRYRAN